MVICYIAIKNKCSQFLECLPCSWYEHPVSPFHLQNHGHLKSSIRYSCCLTGQVGQWVQGEAASSLRYSQFTIVQEIVVSSPGLLNRAPRRVQMDSCGWGGVLCIVRFSAASQTSPHWRPVAPPGCVQKMLPHMAKCSLRA